MDKTTELQFDASGIELPSSRECAKCSRRFGESARFCPFDGELLRGVREVPADPLVGCVVDNRYKVVSVLGEGGMGTVYKVVHRALRREFAVKALRGDLARETNLAERFLREARSAAAITHPNVCEISDFGYLPDGRPYFVMELLSGKPLSWWLRKGGPIPVSAAVRMIEQIAAVLDLAHTTGIIHRDLKPENIVVDDATSHPVVKIVDFGLAKVAGQSRLTRPGVVHGTPHYMSPEQASGGDVDHRSDIYALGVVMYEMFTGRVPFEADTYMGVLTKHMYMAPTPPSELAGSTKELGAIEDVVLRCLQKRPERRYQRMVDLTAALRAVVSLSEDGEAKVRPRRLPVAGKGPLLPLLADELEPRSTAELQRDLARLRPAPSWGTPSVFAALVLSTLVVVLAVYYNDDAPDLDAAAPAASTFDPRPPTTQAIGATHGSVSVARPDPVVSGGSSTAAPVEDAPGPPARVTPTLNRRNESPDRRGRVERSDRARSKRDFGTSDIVDPWSH